MLVVGVMSEARLPEAQRPNAGSIIDRLFEVLAYLAHRDGVCMGVVAEQIGQIEDFKGWLQLGNRARADQSGIDGTHDEALGHIALRTECSVGVNFHPDGTAALFFYDLLKLDAGLVEGGAFGQGMPQLEGFGGNRRSGGFVAAG